MSSPQKPRRAPSPPSKRCKVPTLQQMVIDQLKANIKYVDDVGDLRYKTCRPFLGIIRNPEQLHEIEQNCPQLVPETGEIWQKIIYDKFGADPESILPGRDGDWYPVYKQHEAQFALKKESDVLALKAQFSALSAEKSKKRAVLINETPALSSRRRTNSFQATGFGLKHSKTTNSLEKARKEASVYAKNVHRAVSHVKGGGPSPTKLGIVARPRAIEFAASRSYAPGGPSGKGMAKKAEIIARERARQRLGEDKVIAAPRLMNRVGETETRKTWDDIRRETERLREANMKGKYGSSGESGIGNRKRKEPPTMDLAAKWGDVPFLRRINGVDD